MFKDKEIKSPISNGVLGMILLLTTETMFFTGLISAYIVNKASGIIWPPIGQPRLPIEITAINTIFLLFSAVSLIIASRYFSKGDVKGKGNTKRWLIISIVLGLLFLFIQGNEWIRLVEYGLTTTSSLFGSFFYLIIGMHGLHVLVGVAILIHLYLYLNKSKLIVCSRNRITICSLYWYFVVGIWPVLYILVYLS